MATIEEIQDLLIELSEDIPQFLQTGIPENISSGNLRSIETRTILVITYILEHIEQLTDSGNLLVGEDNPNETPPPKYKIGQFYLQKTAGKLGVNSDLYVFTGVAALGWWKFQDITGDVMYGSVSPTLNPALGANSKIGDLYVKTNTGNASGQIENVWMYINIHDGLKWLSLGDSSNYQNGTLTLLKAGQNESFRVWSAKILSDWLNEKLDASFIFPKELVLSGSLEAKNFIDTQDIIKAADLFNNKQNWDITWIEEDNPNFKLISLKDENSFKGKEPLRLQFEINSPPSATNISITGNLSGEEIIIPKNAKLNFW